MAEPPTMRHLTREIGMVVRGATRTHLRLRHRLLYLFVLTLVVDVIGTALMYTLEHRARGSEIQTVFDAFFWTSAQLTTVSSQMKNPVTTGGKVVDLFLEVWAIAATATLAAAVAAFFLARHHEQAQAQSTQSS